MDSLRRSISSNEVRVNDVLLVTFDDDSQIEALY